MGRRVVSAVRRRLRPQVRYAFLISVFVAGILMPLRGARAESGGFGVDSIHSGNASALLQPPMALRFWGSEPSPIRTGLAAVRTGNPRVCISTFPRAVAYGTSDGRAHIRNPVTGQPIGQADGYQLATTPDVFGFGSGQVSPVGGGCA